MTRIDSSTVVVLTGAASGIGRALALELAGLGARLAISDVDAAGLQETADLVREATAPEVRVDKLDVRDRAAWKEYADSVAADLGAVHVVINNAGVALNGNVVDVSDEQLDFVMDVDFWGVVNGTRAFLPHVIASGDGHVVNISSLFGLMAVPGQAAYNAAKFGVRGFTEALRQEMDVAGNGVSVTCVHPGGVKTAIARNAAAAGSTDQQRSADFFDKHLAKTTAEQAAATIVDGIRKDRARVLVGRDAKALDLLVRLTGSGYQRIVGRVASRTHTRLARQD